MIDKKRHFSITSRLILLALVPMILIEILFSWYHIKTSKEFATESLLEKGQLISEQLAEASTFYLIAGDYDSISQLIKKSFNREQVAFISIHNENGISIAQYSSTDFHPGNTSQYIYFKKTIYNNQIYSPDIFELDDEKVLKKDIGLLQLYLSSRQIEQKTNAALKKTILYSFVIFVIAFLFIYIYTKKLTIPFYGLLKHIKNAEKGNLGEVIKEIEPNEIGTLQLGFNNMTQALLNSHNQLDMDIKNATLKLMDMVNELETKNTELELSKNEALKANKIKSSFLANMSHEIRTPINGIKGFIGLLSKSQLNNEQQRYTKIINQSSSDLITIVNEILDFSKIESGKLTLESRPFDLIDCIETVRDRFFPAAIDKNIDIYLSIYSDVPKDVIGDQTRLKQILNNLIGNAIKFTEKGYVQIKVFLSDQDLDSSLQTIQIEIIDTGIGINHKGKSQLFNAFQQIESDTNRRYSGTGLGLVISRKLARLMKGNITLKSEVTIGSTFTLTLPIQQDNSLLDTPNDSLKGDLFFLIASSQESLSEIQSLFTRSQLITETAIISSDHELEGIMKSLTLSIQHIQYIVIDNRNMNEQHSDQIMLEFANKCQLINLNYKQNTYYEGCSFVSTTTHSSALVNAILHSKDSHIETQKPSHIFAQKKRILIVDDNEINLTFAFELLAQWGHQPTQANSALNALDKYNTLPFDLVLMDIQMPEYDGIEGMKMLRESTKNPDIPIIALTANALPEEETRLRGLGFDGYISKPIDEATLEAIINGDEQKPIIKKVATPQELKSIDYDKTLTLSGNNKALLAQVFQMLLTEIPTYQQNFKNAQTNDDFKLFKVTKHKLEGTTCYASLPKLKSLLIKAAPLTKIDNDMINNILNELDVLRKTLRTL